MKSIMTKQPSDSSLPNSRHSHWIAFSGTREDALEHLPALGEHERLELAADRISLVSDHQRVDLLIRAEIQPGEEYLQAFTLLEICFENVGSEYLSCFLRTLQNKGGRTLH